jgi:hypothetical protein
MSHVARKESGVFDSAGIWFCREIHYHRLTTFTVGYLCFSEAQIL